MWSAEGPAVSLCVCVCAVDSDMVLVDVVHPSLLLLQGVLLLFVAAAAATAGSQG